MKNSIAIAVCLLAALPVLAGDGTVPIWGPTVITEPGHYVLIRDFSFSSGNAITIQADDVTLDLNARTIEGTSSAQYHVRIDSGATRITVRNGTLRGGWSGVGYYSSSDLLRVRIENLTIWNSGDEAIYLSGVEYVDIIGCELRNLFYDAIYVSWGTGARSHPGHISRNVVYAEDRGIYLKGMDGGEIMGNVIIDPGGSGIVIGGSRNLIADNRIYEASTGLLVSASDSILRGNVVGGSSSGISITGDGNQMLGNTSNRNTGNGFYVEGTRNLLDGNQALDNGGYGLEFSTAGQHAYRNNMLRGNGLGPVGGPSNTDAGGNIY